MRHLSTHINSSACSIGPCPVAGCSANLIPNDRRCITLATADGGSREVWICNACKMRASREAPVSAPKPNRPPIYFMISCQRCAMFVFACPDAARKAHELKPTHVQCHARFPYRSPIPRAAQLHPSILVTTVWSWSIAPSMLLALSTAVLLCHR
jgi:hypothetical protein